MDPIDLNAKTDRELLILVAQKQNEIIAILNPIFTWVYGNGKPGAKTQLYVLWASFLVFCGWVFSWK